MQDQSLSRIFLLTHSANSISWLLLARKLLLRYIFKKIWIEMNEKKNDFLPY